jgi:uncharacterized protein (TIGR00255 family)
MIKSMTAFSKSSYEGKEFALDVFIRTYNHRFLDINLKLPIELMHIEGELRSLISRYLSRGRVEMTIRATFLKEGIYQVFINRGIITKLISEIQAINAQHGLSSEIELNSLLRIPGLIEVQTDTQKISKEVLDEIKEIVETCLKSLVQMRMVEGQSLSKDIRERVSSLTRLVDRVETDSKEYGPHVRKTLEKAVQEILSEQPVDSGRMLEEIAYYVERSDITEELVRLRSHLQQANKLIEGNSDAGRKLDFLLQEMLREINTIGSKCDLLAVSQMVIEMKTEVEKLREQAQNVE